MDIRKRAWLNGWGYEGDLDVENEEVERLRETR